MDLLQVNDLKPDSSNPVEKSFTNYITTNLNNVIRRFEGNFRFDKVKNVEEAEIYRLAGNEFYRLKKHELCYLNYALSLQFAPLGSECYSLAISNRSALFYDNKDYDSCLRDIELFLNIQHVKRVRPKILLRQCNCFYYLGRQDDLKVAVENALDDLENGDYEEKIKDSYKEKLLQLLNQPEVSEVECVKVTECKIPEVADGENEKFSSASAAISIRYDQTRGRHVRTNRDIQAGEVLFVEKAFVTSVLYKNLEAPYVVICHYCLAKLTSSVPCKKCVGAAYCNEDCRQSAWKDSHRWECHGMAGSIWYILGIGQPGFRTMCKGIETGFRGLGLCPDQTLLKTRDKADMYRFLDIMCAHLDKADLVPFAEIAVAITYYLKEYTSFFDWLLAHPLCPKGSLSELIPFVGGLLIKHMAQLTFNSSVIDVFGKDVPFSHDVVHLATGLFPAVSVLNHSCDFNICYYYVKDTVVVRAMRDIKAGEEVFNCYGPDYRTWSREQRQTYLRELYFFNCTCTACSDEYMNCGNFDSIICLTCKTKHSLNRIIKRNCVKCGRNLEREIDCFNNLVLAAGEEELRDFDLLQCERLLEYGLTCFSPNHSCIIHWADTLQKFYSSTGDLPKAVRYHQLCVQAKEARYGVNSICVGRDLFNGLVELINAIKKEAIDLNDHCDAVSYLQNLEQRARFVLGMYYPEVDYRIKDVSMELEKLLAAVKK